MHCLNYPIPCFWQVSNNFWQVGLHLCVPQGWDLNCVSQSYQICCNCEICCQTFGGNGCTFYANAPYIAFIYMYIRFMSSYVVFIYLYISHLCSCIVHMLCPLSVTWSHVRDSYMCNMVCCHNDNPTSAPIGDPSMARLPWGL